MYADGSYFILCAKGDILKLRDYFLSAAAELSTHYSEIENPKPTPNTSIDANAMMQKILDGIRQREQEIAKDEQPKSEEPITEIVLEDEPPKIDCMMCHGQGGKDGPCPICGLNTRIETVTVKTQIPDD